MGLSVVSGAIVVAVAAIGIVAVVVAISLSLRRLERALSDALAVTTEINHAVNGTGPDEVSIQENVREGRVAQDLAADVAVAAGRPIVAALARIEAKLDRMLPGQE